MSGNDVRVKFTDGFAVAKDWIAVSSHLAEHIDSNLSRIFTMKGGNWLHFDLQSRISSVCVAAQPTLAVFSLGLDGLLHITRSGQTQTERVIPQDPQRTKLGFVTKIREIAGHLYVCGMSGQIYRRGKGGWEPFDDGVVDFQGSPNALDLYCIDGTSEDNLYAVGQRGLVWRRTNKGWNRVELTKRTITWIRSVSPNEVYLAGNKGSFFKGDGERWQDFSVPNMNDNFECVESFAGKAYLATLSGLYVFNGKEVAPVDTGLKPVPDGSRLHAKDGVLWSFGPNHLCCFDGKKWAYVKHPDNP